MMLFPRAAAMLLATALVATPAFAQPKDEARRCDETTTRLDRNLRGIAEQLVQDQAEAQDKAPAPASGILAKLVELDTLGAHLRCLGFGPKS